MNYTRRVNKEANIHETKTHLSKFLAELGHDERILICRRNRPFAEIRLLPTSPTEPRKIGLGKGSAAIHPSFSDPLPDDLLSLFDGL